MEGFGEGENAFFWRGREDEYPKGCYVLQFKKGVIITFLTTLLAMIPSVFIPAAGSFVIYGLLFGGLVALFILCLDSVYQMYKSLNQWRILANIYTGLCEGVFNMKFSNNWVNGTLYFPKFIVKKQKIDDENGQEITPIVRYDTRLIYEDTDENNTYYYYRSCPFSETQGFTYRNLSVDSPIGLKAAHNGINFPTTIVDLGPLDPCITELCKEQNSDDTCVIIDNLKSSSFQPSEELLGMLIERKIFAINSYREFVWSGVNKWFGADSKPGASYDRNFGNERLGSAGNIVNPGPWRNRVIDGDIAQLLATNNQMGISVFTKDDEDPYYGSGTSWGDEYSNMGTQQNYLTDSFTRIPLIPRNNDLINCLKGGIFGIKQTQVVPYYGWNSNASYGTLNNDYDFDGEILVKGYQQGVTYTTPNSVDTDTWETPAYYDTTTPLPNYGYFNSIPTIVPTSTGSNFILGTGLYFYFGLRQGASSYDRFINEYLPPKDDGQEL